MPTIRTLASRIPSPNRELGPGFTVTSIHASELMNPFIMTDHFRMSQPFFPPHPHAGFSAVTYLLEDAATGFINRDSRGDFSRIEPGDLHWTLAGHGIMHEEVPIEPGKVAHGLQIFVNLAAKDKHLPGRGIHRAAADVPERSADGVRIRVPFGMFDGVGEPLNGVPGDATLIDIQMQAGSTFRAATDAAANAFFHVIKGAVNLGGQRVESGETWQLSGGDVFELASPDGAQLALFTGTPINEPLVAHGPFVMNSAAEITETIKRYQRGEMGTLEASFTRAV
jgi:redox-sensitive bicupin YhaK (pirin superfamily)